MRRWVDVDLAERVATIVALVAAIIVIAALCA